MRNKIAIYSGTVPSTIFIETLIKSLSDKNLDIYLFGKRNTKAFNYLSPNIKVFDSPSGKFKRIFYFLEQVSRLAFFKPVTFFKLLFYFKNNLYHNNDNLIFWLDKIAPVINNLPDIFHIQWAKSLRFWFFLRELFDTKIILSLRGAHINYSPLADNKLAKEYKTLFPNIDFFHAVSKSIMEEASKYADIEKKTKVIYSGFDFSKLKNLNLKERNNKNKKKEFHFISVGRFHWKKAFHLSIIAINKLLNMGLNVTYTIIANDKPSEEILYQIRDLGISKNIFLKKVSTQDQIYQEIYNSDCLILPSVEEGIANVVIESMAIGTQVISSDCGGMNEIIIDEYNGFLFRSRDSKDLVNKMKKIIFLDDIEKKLIIKKGKETIENKFSINKLGNEMEKIYSNVLKT